VKRRIPAAIREGNLEALRDLLREDPSAYTLRTEQGLSFLLLALYYGRRDMAELLRGDGSHLDVVEAAALGDRELVNALIRADKAALNRPSADGFSALHLACYFHHELVVRDLLIAGADANLTSNNPIRNTPLHATLAQMNHIAAESIVGMLVRRSADVRARNAQGIEPIHLAVVNGHESAAKLLISAGADPNARTDEGKTPSMLLAEKVLLPM